MWVAPAAVPERIDAQPVSVWVATAGLVDDRPPLLVVDTSVLEMDAGLAGAAGWAPFEYDWRHGLATDLAEDYAETNELGQRRTDDLGLRRRRVGTGDGRAQVRNP